LKDIKPLHTWGPTGQLGQNSARVADTSGDFLVLLIRAELLRRYPNMVVYAAKATGPAPHTLATPAEERRPEFQGSLGTGVGFWGFRLTAAEARGDAQSAGWFFVLQEHPSEPRFGLEAAAGVFKDQPDSWDKLSWANLAPDEATLSGIGHIDLGAQLPKPPPDPQGAAWHIGDNAVSSDLAYITYREPVRLLVHASRMIPDGA
jgi:hypothetical protein